MITERTKKAIAKFYAEYQADVMLIYGGDKESALAEDVTTYYTLEVQVLKTKINIKETYTGISGFTSTDSITDDDDAKEWLKKWRADFRRARRYWQTNSDTLDRMADGEIEDTNEEED